VIPLDGFISRFLFGDLNPVSLKLLPDGRLFVVEKDGKIIVYKNGTVLEKPLITLDSVDFFNERGLQNIVFDPDFESNSFVYIFYTHKSATNSKNRVVRYEVSGDTVIPSSKLILIESESPISTIHNGGGMAFGADKKLYIAFGDGGDVNTPQSKLLLGKVVRINTDGSIPTDNPFYNDTNYVGKSKAIYALGLRNPFKMYTNSTLDSIFIHDVGTSLAEEVNLLIQPKTNFGWPLYEGIVDSTVTITLENYQNPIFAYGHQDGCAITSGLYYQPKSTNFPSTLIGKYFFGDYCNNSIRMFDIGSQTRTLFISAISRPIDMVMDSVGNIYVLTRGRDTGGSEEANTAASDGEVWKISYTGSLSPSIAKQPIGKVVPNGTRTTLHGLANGKFPVKYEWYKNGVLIPNSDNPNLTTDVLYLPDNGTTFQFKAIANGDTVASQIAVITVSPNFIPTPFIVFPDREFKYIAGQTITLLGMALDTEDGTISGQNLEWRIEFHHDDHWHPFIDKIEKTANPVITFDNVGEPATNVFYRIFLTATDSEGASNRIYKDFYPQLMYVNVYSIPSATKFSLESSTFSTPFQFKTVKGMQRNLIADSIQVIDGVEYVFTNWSTGERKTSIFINPFARNATFVAIYERSDSLASKGISTNNSELTDNPNYIIYPNPSENGNFYILPNSEKIESIKIFNLYGVLIRHYPRGTDSIEDLPKGIFNVQIVTRTKTLYQKIISK
jgi:glucose/arabinose dehydrogenase